MIIPVTNTYACMLLIPVTYTSYILNIFLILINNSYDKIKHIEAKLTFKLIIALGILKIQ